MVLHLLTKPNAFYQSAFPCNVFFPSRHFEIHSNVCYPVKCHGAYQQNEPYLSEVLTSECHLDEFQLVLCHSVFFLASF